MKSAIRHLIAREVLDSRGQPTVEVEVHLQSGNCGAAIVPSGASTGQAEACELRDGDVARYDGRGVQRAVDNVRQVLGPALAGLDPADQRTIDRRLLELDGTPQKTRLGANALLGVSLACAHAAAAARRLPLYRHLYDVWNEDGRQPAPRLPLPMVNMISGGLHAGGNIDFQDFLVQPVGAPSYAVGLEWIVRIYRRLGELLKAAGYEGRLVGDEGGFGPRLASNRQAAEFVVQAIEKAGLRPGPDVTLAIDVASTHFFQRDHYRLKAEGDTRLSADELTDRLEAMLAAFPIESLEDPLAEEDWPGWERLTARLGTQVRLVGDDLFATNSRRLAHGIERRVANAVLIKVNQIGTLSETLDTMRLARQAGYWCVVSARSGETEDSTIADLAVATGAEQIKIGSIVRSERLAKYNRLLRIAEELES